MTNPDSKKQGHTKSVLVHSVQQNMPQELTSISGEILASTSILSSVRTRQMQNFLFPIKPEPYTLHLDPACVYAHVPIQPPPPHTHTHTQAHTKSTNGCSYCQPTKEVSSLRYQVIMHSCRQGTFLNKKMLIYFLFLPQKRGFSLEAPC